MLIGSYEGKVDAQGRIVIPQRFRETLDMGVVLARGIDGCIDVYPPAEWERVVEEVRRLPRSRRNARIARRLTFSGAFKAIPDRQGRVQVPAELRQHAGIADGVVVIGQDTYAEIWAPDRWAQQVAQGKNLAEIVETLAASNAESEAKHV